MSDTLQYPSLYYNSESCVTPEEVFSSCSFVPISVTGIIGEILETEIGETHWRNIEKLFKNIMPKSFSFFVMKLLEIGVNLTCKSRQESQEECLRQLIACANEIHPYSFVPWYSMLYHDINPLIKWWEYYKIFDTKSIALHSSLQTVLFELESYTRLFGYRNTNHFAIIKTAVINIYNLAKQAKAEILSDL
jgi:hypothetical protein